MSLNLNAYAERFVCSIKVEYLNRMIFIGQASLRRAIAEYVAHYHGERNWGVGSSGDESYPGGDQIVHGTSFPDNDLWFREGLASGAEPPALLLLGSGLVVLGVVGRPRQFRNRLDGTRPRSEGNDRKPTQC
jgi:hypothetical protein